MRRASRAQAADGAPADAAGRLLRLAAGLLPAGRREWGQAMRAELAQIGPGPLRLRFALSCLRGSLTQPQLISTAGYPLLMLGVIIGVVAWTGRITYVPLRAALISLVVTLVALSWLATPAGTARPGQPEPGGPAGQVRWLWPGRRRCPGHHPQPSAGGR